MLRKVMSVKQLIDCLKANPHIIHGLNSVHRSGAMDIVSGLKVPLPSSSSELLSFESGLAKKASDCQKKIFELIKEFQKSKDQSDNKEVRSQLVEAYNTFIQVLTKRYKLMEGLRLTERKTCTKIKKCDPPEVPTCSEQRTVARALIIAKLQLAQVEKKSEVYRSELIYYLNWDPTLIELEERVEFFLVLYTLEPKSTNAEVPINTCMDLNLIVKSLDESINKINRLMQGIGLLKDNNLKRQFGLRLIKENDKKKTLFLNLNKWFPELFNPKVVSELKSNCKSDNLKRLIGCLCGLVQKIIIQNSSLQELPELLAHESPTNTDKDNP